LFQSFDAEKSTDALRRIIKHNMHTKLISGNPIEVLISIGDIALIINRCLLDRILIDVAIEFKGFWNVIIEEV
jgi:hypothetical protein